MNVLTTAEVRNLLSLCEAADDQDTGSLDAFRQAATVGIVAELARYWLQKPVTTEVTWRR